MRFANLQVENVNELKSEAFKNTFIVFAEKSMNKTFLSILLQDVIECFQNYRIQIGPTDHKNDFMHSRKWQAKIKKFEKLMMYHDIESYRLISK